MTTRTIDKTIARELLELENQYWQSIQKGDVDAAMKATDDPCIIAGASGVGSIDRASFKRIMEDANWSLKSFRIDNDVQVRQISDDMALMAYKVHEELTVDGQPVSLDAADTSVWLRRGGGWACAMHTESLLGDAYGRDRKTK